MVQNWSEHNARTWWTDQSIVSPFQWQTKWIFHFHWILFAYERISFELFNISFGYWMKTLCHIHQKTVAVVQFMFAFICHSIALHCLCNNKNRWQLINGCFGRADRLKVRNAKNVNDIEANRKFVGILCLDPFLIPRLYFSSNTIEISRDYSFVFIWFCHPLHGYDEFHLKLLLKWFIGVAEYDGRKYFWFHWYVLTGLHVTLIDKALHSFCVLNV